MKRCRGGTGTILLLLLLPFGAAFAQSAGDAVYRLHGTVVNGVTGKPVPRALVESGDRRLGTMTDSEGHFAIEIHVPPRGEVAPAPGQVSTDEVRRALRRFGGGLFLTAQKPGYLPSTRPTVLPLDETLSSIDAEIKLMPAAVISGRIFTAGNDAPSNVRVSLLLHGVNDGERTWVQVGMQNTGRDGDFRFSNVRPGEYTVMTSEWNGGRPMPPERTAVGQEYPPVFLGDGPSLATAGTLHLRYGDAAQPELHLHSANYYPITVPISGTGSGAGVSVRVVDSGTVNGYQLGYNPQNRAVEGSLPSGHYNLAIGSYGPQPSFAEVALNVEGAPVRTPPVSLSPAANIAVRVHAEFTSETSPSTHFSAPVGSGGGFAPPPGPGSMVRILLRPEETGGGFVSGSILPASPDELTLGDVQPGRYFVQAQAVRGYVASLRSGGTDLLQRQLIVEPGSSPEPIDVTLRDDGSTVNGTVTTAEAALPQQIFIVLLPTDTTARFAQNFAGPDGKFSAGNLAPGSYRVLAFRSMQGQIPYRDASAMHRFDGKGTAVHVTAGQVLNIEVPLLDETDSEEN